MIAILLLFQLFENSSVSGHFGTLYVIGLNFPIKVFQRKKSFDSGKTTRKSILMKFVDKFVLDILSIASLGGKFLISCNQNILPSYSTLTIFRKEGNFGIIHNTKTFLR